MTASFLICTAGFRAWKLVENVGKVPGPTLRMGSSAARLCLTPMWPEVCALTSLRSPACTWALQAVPQAVRWQASSATCLLTILALPHARDARPSATLQSTLEQAKLQTACHKSSL